ncbi:MAG: hypothetical protein E7520_05440 [Ruminococcaceae bacterium]|nr:hypothetical protein [Oscillospiraceae bacterium]
MPEKKMVNINDMPKWFHAIMILAPIAGLLLITTQLDNDFYFIYKTGEYIVHHGFPTTDFLSMHSTMSIIPQQWLTGVVFYYLYSLLGRWGVIGFIYLCYALVCVIIHKLVMMICDNLFIANIISFCSDLLLAVMFEKTRPQAITYVIIITELYLLERFVQKKKIIYLCFIPLLSVLQINFHCSMWIMLFVFALPFAAAAIPVKIGKIRQEPCCSFLKLLICGVITFAAGFLNPYGIKAITYLATSFGYSEINVLVKEMAKTSLGDAVGVLFFVILALTAIITLCLKKKNYSVRYVLLFGGTALMALMHHKSMAYFYIGGLSAFSYMLKDIQVSLPLKESKEPPRSEKTRRPLLIITLIVALCALAAMILIPPANNASHDRYLRNMYTDLDAIIEILDREDKNHIILYTGFNEGQYLEFYDYHPYIDGRAELFLKDNNGEFDYLKEYNDMKNGKIYYKDFVNKYHFTHLIVDSVSLHLMNDLKHDDDYELVYESDTENLFILKD